MLLKKIFLVLNQNEIIKNIKRIVPITNAMYVFIIKSFHIPFDIYIKLEEFIYIGITLPTILNFFISITEKHEYYFFNCIFHIAYLFPLFIVFGISLLDQTLIIWGLILVINTYLNRKFN